MGGRELERGAVKVFSYTCRFCLSTYHPTYLVMVDCHLYCPLCCGRAKPTALLEAEPVAVARERGCRSVQAQRPESDGFLFNCEGWCNVGRQKKYPNIIHRVTDAPAKWKNWIGHWLCGGCKQRVPEVTTERRVQA